MNAQIKALKALADETRFRIVGLLMENESLCVCRIVDALKMKQSAVSKALRVLKEAGIINDLRKTQWIYYSLNRTTGNPILPALNSIYVSGLKPGLNRKENTGIKK